VIITLLMGNTYKGVLMYRTRLVCDAYARMNIILLLGGARGGFSNETYDVHRSLMYVEIPISTHAQHEHGVQAWTRSESHPTCT